MEKVGAKWNYLSQGFSQKVASTSCFVFNSLPASVDFSCLLIAFANILDQDQAQQNVRPDLDPNCLTHMVLIKSSIQREKYGTINFSDLFTILGLWVLRLAVSHINESDCKIMSPEHYFSWKVYNTIASWDLLK